MINIYAKKLTPRLRYTVSLLFEHIYVTGYQLFDDKKVYKAEKGVHINYSADRTLEGLWIRPSGLLKASSIEEVVPAIGEYKSITTLFADCKGELPFDLFSAVFFLVSRYEEYLPYQKDTYGRFEANQSVAFLEGFINVPVVNYYALFLMEALDEKYQFSPEKTPAYRPQVTFDIDNAYAFLHKSVGRKAGSLIRKVALGKLQLLKAQVKAEVQKKDPFDTYDEIAATMATYQHQPYFFILMRGTGGVDRAINFDTVKGKALLEHLNAIGEVGLHPSFASNDSRERLSREKNELEEIAGKPVCASRQHFIKLNLPDTYRKLIEAGITEDFTMGYASFPGFRAGIATPFPFFNLADNHVTELMVHPFVFMDATLKYYANAAPEQALLSAVTLIREVKKVDGYCSVVFHNESLSDWHHWRGWKMFFDEVVKELFYEA